MSTHCGLGIYRLKGNVYIHEQDYIIKKTCKVTWVAMLTSFKSELGVFKRIKECLAQLGYCKAIILHYKCCIL